MTLAKQPQMKRTAPQRPHKAAARGGGVVTMSLDERIKRYERIIELRDHGLDGKTLTLEEVGQQFRPPLSRQFIQRQIAKGAPKAIGRPRKQQEALA